MMELIAAIVPFLSPAWAGVILSTIGSLVAAITWAVKVESRLNHQAEKDELNKLQHAELKAAIASVDQKIDDLQSMLINSFLGKKNH